MGFTQIFNLNTGTIETICKILKITSQKYCKSYTKFFVSKENKYNAKIMFKGLKVSSK